MPDWREAPLQSFLERITYGFTNPMPTMAVGPFMITARDINGGRILYEQARRTSQAAFENELTDKSRPDLGDVLVTKDGTLGRMAVVDRSNVCINQSVALLKPSPLIKPRYLKYLLEAPQTYSRMIGDADGTTIKHIYITRLGKMIVRVPDIATQQQILSVLAALDDKIELNRRLNETLEAMAQAIFRDWFVDFGPTRRKCDGLNDPVAIMGGPDSDLSCGSSHIKGNDAIRVISAEPTFASEVEFWINIEFDTETGAVRKAIGYGLMLAHAAKHLPNVNDVRLTCVGPSIDLKLRCTIGKCRLQKARPMK